jgi:hypothetical protein
VARLVAFTLPRKARLSRVFTQVSGKGAGDDDTEKRKQKVEFGIHFFYLALTALLRLLLTLQEAFQWLKKRRPG